MQNSNQSGNYFELIWCYGLFRDGSLLSPRPEHLRSTSPTTSNTSNTWVNKSNEILWKIHWFLQWLQSLKHEVFWKFDQKIREKYMKNSVQLSVRKVWSMNYEWKALKRIFQTDIRNGVCIGIEAQNRWPLASGSPVWAMIEQRVQRVAKLKISIFFITFSNVYFYTLFGCEQTFDWMRFCVTIYTLLAFTAQKGLVWFWRVSQSMKKMINKRHFKEFT